jgi:OmpA family
VSGRQDLEVARKRETRMQLYEEMEKSLPTLDTTRGLVATVSDESFRGAGLRTVYADHLAGMASTLARHPGVHIDLEGYSSTAEGQPLSRERADAVRRALIAGGVSAKSAAAAGLGDTRPLGSNATPQGQKQNSRVEIVVTGESIGDAPFWQPNNSSSDSRRLSPGSIE